MNHRIASLLLLSASSLPLMALPAQTAATNSNPVATAWIPVGPDGGDARSFAADPSDSKHIYLGTTNSWVYESRDGGASWHRLAKLSPKEDLMLDNIVVDESDPKTIYVGAFVIDHPDGGLFISHDAGKSWTKIAGMDGQSIRAVAQAPSDPKTLVIGALKGVFRSEDSGMHWDQISPASNADLHEVESIAIDPKDPKTIYAGTWHLPWKTTDGGANWHNIKQGLIDDSDVFSIIIDSTTPQTVYTSACSGIYKSDNGGEMYHKIQGIPSTARRTRVLMQDPVDHAIVYAGTTEGLYRTTSAGTNWSRLTGPDVIINDVYVDPKNDSHVLLATDRGGVLMSNDKAVTFAQSNQGFSQRQVSALAKDVKDPNKLYAGVVNDKAYGGVFVSSDSGKTWQQQSQGLDGRDVFSLSQSPEGTLAAGTSHGIFLWKDGRWQTAGKVVKIEEKTVLTRTKTRSGKPGKATKTTKTIEVPGGEIDGRVNGLDLSGSTWYAATSAGLYRSMDQGKVWIGGPVQAQSDFLNVHGVGLNALATRRTGLAVSQDGGTTWQPQPLPGKLTAVRTSTMTPSGSMWVGGREGVYYSTDKGANWNYMATLPFSDISGIQYESDLKRIVITSWSSTWIMAVNEADKSWKWWDAGWHVRGVQSNSGRLLAASLYNGVVVQPQSAPSNPGVGVGGESVAAAELNLRPFVPADLLALKTLDALCFPPLIAYSRAELHYFVRRPRSATVIAESAGAIAGFCITHWELESGNKLGHIITIDVAPQMRRSGVGRRLMEWSERQLQEAGCLAIALEVARGNHGAQRFYTVFGYSVTARIPGYYADGSEALVMRKELPSRTSTVL